MASKKNTSTPRPVDPGRKSQREKQMGREPERSRPTGHTRSEANDAASGTHDRRGDEDKEN
jgi:hypothetical protein